MVLFGGHVCLIGKTYRRALCSVRASVASYSLKALARWQRHDKKYINSLKQDLTI